MSKIIELQLNGINIFLILLVHYPAFTSRSEERRGGKGWSEQWGGGGVGGGEGGEGWGGRMTTGGSRIWVGRSSLQWQVSGAKQWLNAAAL